MSRTRSVPVRTSFRVDKAVTGKLAIYFKRHRDGYVLACPWWRLTLRVLLAMHRSTYAERWFKISRGRWPKGFLDRLISFLGLDSAKETPRYSPIDFQGVFFGG